LDACDTAYEIANALAASAQLAVPATAAREFDARTALQEMRKAAEYQSALAKAIEAKPAARSPAAASFALFVVVLLLFFLGWMDEKRAEPVPEGKEARPGEEEEEEEAAAAAAEVEGVEIGVDEDEPIDRRPTDGLVALGCGGALERKEEEEAAVAVPCIRCGWRSEACIIERRKFDA